MLITLLTLLGDANKKQLCHVNMLKQYIDRDSSSVTPISVVSSVPQEQSEMNSEDMKFTKSDPASSKLQNSDILKDLDQKLSHLDPVQRKELKHLIHQYEHLFPDIPTRTDKIYHDVNVEDSQPVKQHPYRMNPTKQKNLKEEIQYLLDNDFMNQVKVNGVHLAFLCQNLMEHIGCAPITGRSII